MVVREYVWEFPVRLTHWANALSIVVLSFTGYYIGHPFLIAEGATAYVMGTMRFVHFIAGYVFLLSLLVRIYWFFVGNRYARWRAYVAMNRQDFRNLLGTLQYYLLLRWRPLHFMGHNPLAGMTYQLVYLIFAVEIVTGLALYSLEQEGGIWSFAFAWVLLFGIQTVRLVHHLGMWLLIGFVIHHVYSAMVMDMEESTGLMGSIISGFKFNNSPKDRH